MLTAPNILSQCYDAVLEPDAEHAAAAIEVKAFAIASKSIATESLASIKEGAIAVPHHVGRGHATMTCFKYFRRMFSCFILMLRMLQ
jgi:hypothetical protein